ncbi:MAG: hypothetical protein WCK88_08065 [bacterium]
MKKRTIITIIGIIIIALVLKNVLSSHTPAVVTSTPTRAAKIVQTQVVGKSLFSEQVHVTGRVAADKETTISTQ